MSAPPVSHAVLCRFGELFLKGGNRGIFEQTLAKNIRRAVADVPGARVETPHGRVIVHAPADRIEDACARLERVFGLVSISSVVETAADVEAIEAAAVTAALAAIERDPARGASFRVQARRSDKRFPLSSLDLAARVGAKVAAATGMPVKLVGAALTIGIEVSSTSGFVFADTRAAPGGLPAGTSGHGLLLLSGGIDSPVAGWLSAKRGLSLDGLYFHSPPFVGEKSKDKVVSLARVLASWQALRTLYVAPFTDVQKRLRDAGPAELAVVLYRRMMMRIADRIADRTRAMSLVTGENLGQVASQTVPNLTTIENAARHLVLRPLVTYDKMETTALARRIGTYDISALPYEDCCSLFVPPHPATAARVQDAERAEARLEAGVDAEADAVADATEKIDLT